MKRGEVMGHFLRCDGCGAESPNAKKLWVSGQWIEITIQDRHQKNQHTDTRQTYLLCKDCMGITGPPTPKLPWLQRLLAPLLRNCHNEHLRREHDSATPARPDMTAIEFLKQAGLHGRIVASSDLTELQIAEARHNTRFFVDEESGLGWAMLPWNLRTARDATVEPK